MKKFILMTLMGLFSMSIWADHVISDEEYQNLPEETRVKLETKETLNSASKYASLGKEIGVAVNETLVALEGSAERISKTPLGKTAIFICVWKLLWKDIVGIIVGLILLGFSIGMTMWSLKHFLISPSEEIVDIMRVTDGAIILFPIVAIVISFLAAMTRIF